VFIYLIDTASPFSAVAADLFQQLRQQSMTGITSVLTLTELLVKPLQTGRRGLAAHYEALVRSVPYLDVVDIDARIARRAAILRAKHATSTADALQIAAALEHGATAFITNDRRLRRIEEIAVVLLADHIRS
jgi:predicted nucleic acid-binding protein